MMKNFFFIIAILFFSVKAAFCQVNPIDTMGYRMSVASSVKDVAVVTGMTQSEQIALATFFQNAEDTMNSAVNSGTTGNSLKQIQNQLIIQFQALLTAQELAAYRLQRKNSVYATLLTAGN